LENIISNLLDNALKYAFEATNVHTCCYFDNSNNAYIFEITSFGSEIPIDKTDFIFERGARLSKSGSGQGLGLYNARRYAALMDSEVVLYKNERISKYFLPAISMADIFYTGKDYPSKWSFLAEEKRTLKNPSKNLAINQAAKDYEIYNLYDEVISSGAPFFFDKKGIVEDSFILTYDQPTYRTVFKVIIPQK